MNLILSVVSKQKATLGAARLFDMDSTAYKTIGSGADDDWRLPDSDGSIVSNHAAIGFTNNCFYLSNTSNDEIYINGANLSVGQGESEYIKDGDHVSLGPYTIAVSVRATQPETLPAHEQGARPPAWSRTKAWGADWPSEARPPLASDPIASDPIASDPIASDRVQIDAILASRPAAPEAKAPGSETAPLLDPDSLESIIQDLRGQGLRSPAPEEEGQEAAGGEMAPFPQADLELHALAPVAEAEPPALRSSAAEAFWQGLGVTPGWLSAEDEAELFLQMGLTIRAMADGLTDIYAASRDAPRGPRPKLAEGGRENVNPFRSFSSGTDALLAAIGGNGQQRPTIDQAAEACFDDLAARLAAVPDAVSQSATQCLAELDPDRVLHDLPPRRGGLFRRNRANERLLSDLRRRSADFAGDAQHRFVAAFEKAFADAYDSHRDWIRRYRNAK